jgi:integrase
VKLLPENNARHIYLSADQVEALAACMPRSGDMVRLAAYTGLRLGELLRLEPRDVVRGALVIRDTKNGDPRTVPLPKRVRHIAKALPWAATNEMRRNEWDAARKACKLAHVHWHDLRHTYASFLAAGGFSDREIGALLGHKSAQMVRRYSHLRQQHLAKKVSGL